MHAPTREFTPPTIIERPFAPPIETTLDLPCPLSVNRTRKINPAVLKEIERWIENSDKEILAAGGMRKFAKMPGAFEAILILDESLNELDLDNAPKIVIDYARRLGLVRNDSKKFMRRVVIEWGDAPRGCRLILRSILEDA